MVWFKWYYNIIVSLDFSWFKTGLHATLSFTENRTPYHPLPHPHSPLLNPPLGTSLRFWENKGWIITIDPYGWFQWYFRYLLGRRSKDDKRQNNRWKKIVSRFRGKLVKMIGNAGSKYDDYSIATKIRQILLHWDYELT